VDPLHRSLLGILDGPLGGTFASPTSTHIDPNATAVCIDISRIGEADGQLTAAAMLAAWSDGLGTVAASHALADAGLAPRRWFFTVLDELWRPHAGGLRHRRPDRRADPAQPVARPGRREDHAHPEGRRGAGQRGGQGQGPRFRRARRHGGGAGLPRAEMQDLGKVVGLSRREIDLVSSWSSPPGWAQNGENEEPPGRGRFLIKVGGRPGIPIRVTITDTERHLHDTNTRWVSNGYAERVAAERIAAEAALKAGDGPLPAPRPDGEPERELR
jgi:hypothetical protein